MVIFPYAAKESLKQYLDTHVQGHSRGMEGGGVVFRFIFLFVF